MSQLAATRRQPAVNRWYQLLSLVPKDSLGIVGQRPLLVLDAEPNSICQEPFLEFHRADLITLDASQRFGFVRRGQFSSTNPESTAAR